MDILLYTDGSSTGGWGPGGWAWVAILQRPGKPPAVFCDSGGGTNESNNTMELTAAIKGLEWITKLGLHRLGQVVLLSDSEYVLRIAARIYTAKANLDLATKLQSLYAKVGAEGQWVKAHNGNEWNERCDSLAKRAKEQHI